MTRVSLVCALVGCVAGIVTAQEPAPSPATDAAAALQEFRALVLKKVQPSEMKARDAQVGEWAARTAELDLGEYGFVREIARYFARDFDGAGTGLLAWLDAHPELPTRDFDTLVARILMAKAVMAGKDGLWPVYDKASAVALARYEQPAMVYRACGMVLQARDDDEARKRQVALLAALFADARLAIPDRLETGKLILGAGAKAAGGGAAERPQPKLVPFTAKDTDGVERSVAGYKGKVLLIDFWATWCGPCIGEMPNVVAAYGKFHEKGFEVLGVSLDRAESKAKMPETMAKLGMTWPQIADGGGWKAQVAVDCNVKSIPATFLLDRTGAVRFTNLRGKALDEAIEKLLAEPGADPK